MPPLPSITSEAKSSVNKSRTIRTVKSGSAYNIWGAVVVLDFFSRTSH